MGKLVQVATNTVTSAVASVTLTGINDDSVYMVAYNNWNAVNDNVTGYIRVTEGGTPNSSANYDFSSKNLDATATFGNEYVGNNNHFDVVNSGTGTGEIANAILYLYNFNSTTEYAFITIESTLRNSTAKLKGHQGGGVFTQTGTARDGIHFLFSSGNIASGVFTMYKVL